MHDGEYHGCEDPKPLIGDGVESAFLNAARHAHGSGAVQHVRARDEQVTNGRAIIRAAEVVVHLVEHEEQSGFFATA